MGRGFSQRLVHRGRSPGAKQRGRCALAKFRGNQHPSRNSPVGSKGGKGRGPGTAVGQGVSVEPHLIGPIKER